MDTIVNVKSRNARLDMLKDGLDLVRNYGFGLTVLSLSYALGYDHWQFGRVGSKLVSVLGTLIAVFYIGGTLFHFCAKHWPEGRVAQALWLVFISVTLVFGGEFCIIVVTRYQEWIHVKSAVSP
jgi:hypothetical protein